MEINESLNAEDELEIGHGSDESEDAWINARTGDTQ